MSLVCLWYERELLLISVPLAVPRGELYVQQVHFKRVPAN